MILEIFTHVFGWLFFGLLGFRFFFFWFSFSFWSSFTVPLLWLVGFLLIQTCLFLFLFFLTIHNRIPFTVAGLKLHTNDQFTWGFGYELELTSFWGSCPSIFSFCKFISMCFTKNILLLSWSLLIESRSWSLKILTSRRFIATGPISIYGAEIIRIFDSMTSFRK